MSADESAKLAKAISSRIPLGRWGEPEDLAKAVLFLVSDDSSFINAIELMVDGGATGAPWGAPISRTTTSTITSTKVTFWNKNANQMLQRTGLLEVQES